jgi:hypothetical protein
VGVPDDAASGKAKVTLSFAAWIEGKVIPATYEIEVRGASSPGETLEK